MTRSGEEYLDAVAFILAEGEALAQLIRSTLPERRVRNYPTYGPGAREFLFFLEDLLDETLREQESLARRFPVSARDLHEDLLREAKRLNFVLLYIATLLDRVEGAASEQLPFSLIPFCERLLRQFLPDACVIFKSAVEYNYEIEILGEEALGDLTPESIRRKYTWPVVIVRLPSAVMAAVPTHALVAHEIGHAVYHSRVPRIDREVPDDGELEQLSVAYLGELGVLSSYGLPAESGRFESLLGTDPGRAVVAVVGARVSRVVENWIEEFFSDCVGCLLVGPAFFHAYASFLGSVMPLDRSSDGHPSNRERLRNMLYMLREHEGYTTTTVAVNSARLFGAWGNLLECFPLEQRGLRGFEDVVWKIASRIAVATLPEVRSTADTAVGKLQYGPLQYAADVSEFVQLLEEERVPPIERRSGAKVESVDFAGVFNVGWEVLLGQEALRVRMDEPFDREAAFRGRCLVSDMIFRALELGEVKRRWEQAGASTVGE